VFSGGGAAGGVSGGAGLGAGGGRSAGTSGAFGSRTLGGTLSGGNRSFRGSGFGLQSADTVGQLSGSERFMRGNRQAGQFVGSDTGDVRNFMSAMTGLGQGLQRGNQRGRNDQGQPDNEDDRDQRRARLRTVLRAGFDAPANPVLTANAREASTRRLDRLAGEGRLQVTSPLSVTMEGRTAVLRGAVATDQQRALIERLMLLEAGIEAVQNELAVQPPDTPAVIPPN
jgi:hypothetical protein